MINQQTQTLLDRFKKIPLLSEYKAILIGGTALAYHLSHRESFDLDICFPFSDKLPELNFLETFEEVITMISVFTKFKKIRMQHQSERKVNYLKLLISFFFIPKVLR